MDLFLNMMHPFLFHSYKRKLTL